MQPRGSLELTTPRLVMRPLDESDAERLHALWTSPGVRRFLFDDKVIDLPSTTSHIATSARLFSGHGYGLWGVRTRDGSRLIGFGGFWHFRDTGDPEILYGVIEGEWSRGYATEIGRRLVAYAGDVLHMPVVRASTDATHAASRRVLEKLDFRLVRRALVEGVDTVFYEYPTGR